MSFSICYCVYFPFNQSSDRNWPACCDQHAKDLVAVPSRGLVIDFQPNVLILVKNLRMKPAFRLGGSESPSGHLTWKIPNNFRWSSLVKWLEGTVADGWWLQSKMLKGWEQATEPSRGYWTEPSRVLSLRPWMCKKRMSSLRFRM